MGHDTTTLYTGDVSGRLRMRTPYPTPLSARMTAPRALSPAAGSRGGRLREEFSANYWFSAKEGEARHVGCRLTALLREAQQETGSGKSREEEPMSEYGISLNEGRLETTFCKKWPTLQHSKLNVLTLFTNSH